MPDNEVLPICRPGALDTNAVMVFVSVVKAGSFTRAARAMAMPTSTVSDRVSALERQLGVTLLHRTTRKLTLTEIGREFFEHAEAGGSLILAAAERATQAQSTPRGTLRITAPADVSTLVLAQAVAEYRARFPDVSVELNLTNRYVDLLTEGFDLALRGGPLRGTGLRAKRLGTGHLILVASPDYLRQNKPPRTPKDLTQHRCIRFVRAGSADPDASWHLRSSGGRTLRIRPTFVAGGDSMTMVLDLARMGQGIALVPDSLTRDRLKQRDVLRVLPDWTTAESPVHLVYPAQRQALPKVRAMIPILEKHFVRMITR